MSAKRPQSEEPKPLPQEQPAGTQQADTPGSNLEELQQELERTKDHYLRTLADTENLRKRLQREHEQTVKYATERLVRELLPIIDSLDHALVAVDKRTDADAVIKGIHLIYRQFLGLMEKEGVHRIPTVGEPFDPHRHEAIGFVHAQEGQKDGAIVEEIQVGYTMHGHMLRPALVKVAKQHLEDQSEEAPNGEGHRD